MEWGKNVGKKQKQPSGESCFWDGPNSVVRRHPSFWSPCVVFCGSLTAGHMYVFHRRLGSAPGCCSAVGVVGDDLGHARREPLARGDVQELVRAVRVRARAEHAGDEELRRGELPPQHPHERDRAALAHVHGGSAEVGTRSGVDAGLEPGREQRRVPARGDLLGFPGDPRAVGRAGGEYAAEGGVGGFGVDARRDAHRELDGRVGPQHVAGVPERRQTIRAGDREGGPPGTVEDQLDRVIGERERAVDPRELVEDGIPEDGSRRLGLVGAIAGDIARVKLVHQDVAGIGVFDAGEELAQDPEGRGHDARGVAGVHALAQDVDAQVARDEPRKDVVIQSWS